ncbi:hypothetical protein [Candidatus Villigracilis saccharophilus]|uniref:hypothetical protein n=1 Tax=Candidatus Villigracilis saccharophilus TaxID=3140684 RepID=UPI003136FAE2|nr:hypothetical protein [Anaerolineales bacterium]
MSKKILFAVIPIIILACNIPGGLMPVSTPNYIATITAQAALLAQQTMVSSAQTASPLIVPTEAVIQPTVAAAPPPEAVIQSNLPTVTMDGGTGYVFSSQAMTKDERDIWWNAAQFVPERTVRMVSLGIINSPSDINSLTFAGAWQAIFEPVIGEGYGVEISSNDEKKYAVIRVMKIESDGKITFDWVYPYNGPVTSNP